MEIDALGGDIGSQEDPDRGGFGAEALDQTLLLLVIERPVEDLDLLRLELEFLLEVVVQETEGVYPLGEDDDALCIALLIEAQLLEHDKQGLELAIVPRFDARD